MENKTRLKVDAVAVLPKPLPHEGSLRTVIACFVRALPPAPPPSSSARTQTSQQQHQQQHHRSGSKSNNNTPLRETPRAGTRSPSSTVSPSSFPPPPPLTPTSNSNNNRNLPNNGAAVSASMVRVSTSLSSPDSFNSHNNNNNMNNMNNVTKSSSSGSGGSGTAAFRSSDPGRSALFPRVLTTDMTMVAGNGSGGDGAAAGCDGMMIPAVSALSDVTPPPPPQERTAHSVTTNHEEEDDDDGHHHHHQSYPSLLSSEPSGDNFYHQQQYHQHHSRKQSTCSGGAAAPRSGQRQHQYQQRRDDEQEQEEEDLPPLVTYILSPLSTNNTNNGSNNNDVHHHEDEDNNVLFFFSGFSVVSVPDDRGSVWWLGGIVETIHSTFSQQQQQHPPHDVCPQAFRFSVVNPSDRTVFERVLMPTHVVKMYRPILFPACCSLTSTSTASSLGMTMMSTSSSSYSHVTHQHRQNVNSTKHHNHNSNSNSFLRDSNVFASVSSMSARSYLEMSQQSNNDKNKNASSHHFAASIAAAQQRSEVTKLADMSSGRVLVWGGLHLTHYAQLVPIATSAASSSSSTTTTTTSSKHHHDKTTTANNTPPPPPTVQQKLQREEECVYSNRAWVITGVAHETPDQCPILQPVTQLGDIPSPRAGAAVCALRDGETIVLHGGLRATGHVLSDIYVGRVIVGQQAGMTSSFSPNNSGNNNNNNNNNNDNNSNAAPVVGGGDGGLLTPSSTCENFPASASSPTVASIMSQQQRSGGGISSRGRQHQQLQHSARSEESPIDSADDRSVATTLLPHHGGANSARSTATATGGAFGKFASLQTAMNSTFTIQWFRVVIGHSSPSAAWPSAFPSNTSSSSPSSSSPSLFGHSLTTIGSDVLIVPNPKSTDDGTTTPTMTTTPFVLMPLSLVTKALFVDPSTSCCRYSFNAQRNQDDDDDDDEDENEDVDPTSESRCDCFCCAAEQLLRRNIDTSSQLLERRVGPLVCELQPVGVEVSFGIVDSGGAGTNNNNNNYQHHPQARRSCNRIFSCGVLFPLSSFFTMMRATQQQQNQQRSSNNVKKNHTTASPLLISNVGFDLQMRELNLLPLLRSAPPPPATSSVSSGASTIPPSSSCQLQIPAGTLLDSNSDTTTVRVQVEVVDHVYDELLDQVEFSLLKPFASSEELWQVWCQTLVSIVLGMYGVSSSNSSKSEVDAVDEQQLLSEQDRLLDVAAQAHAILTGNSSVVSSSSSSSGVAAVAAAGAPGQQQQQQQQKAQQQHGQLVSNYVCLPIVSENKSDGTPFVGAPLTPRAIERYFNNLVGISSLTVQLRKGSHLLALTQPRGLLGKGSYGAVMRCRVALPTPPVATLTANVFDNEEFSFHHPPPSHQMQQHQDDDPSSASASASASARLRRLEKAALELPKVACKLSVGSNENPTTVRRMFILEAAIMRRLRHPCIVQCIGYEPRRGSLILEMCSGGKVSHEHASPLPLHRVRCVLRCVLSALHFLHSLGVAHLDVKPTNILWATDDPSEEVAKLADFGVSSFPREWLEDIASSIVAADQNNGGAAVTTLVSGGGGGGGVVATTTTTTASNTSLLLLTAAGGSNQTHHGTISSTASTPSAAASSANHKKLDNANNKASTTINSFDFSNISKSFLSQHPTATLALLCSSAAAFSSSSSIISSTLVQNVVGSYMFCSPEAFVNSARYQPPPPPTTTTPTPTHSTSPLPVPTARSRGTVGGGGGGGGDSAASSQFGALLSSSSNPTTPQFGVVRATQPVSPMVDVPISSSAKNFPTTTTASAPSSSSSGGDAANVSSTKPPISPPPPTIVVGSGGTPSRTPTPSSSSASLHPHSFHPHHAGGLSSSSSSSSSSAAAPYPLDKQDIFSLGVTALFLVAVKLPERNGRDAKFVRVREFFRKHKMASLGEHQEADGGASATTTATNEQEWDMLWAVIEACMLDDPKSRPSAAELLTYPFFC